jgi:hypothetical protein
MAGAHLESLARTASGGRADPLILGGSLSALGAAGVVVTSAFYLLSPPAAAGPVQPLDLAAAMAGAVRGAVTLHAAGVVGIVGDLVWATAALLIAQALSRRGRGVAAAGWIALFLSIVIFTLVDGMTGYVFPPLAAANNAPAFEGFKRLWDMLFLLGAATYGAGLTAVCGAELATPVAAVNRYLAFALLLVGLIGGAGALAGLAGFTGLPTDKIVGASIGVGSALLIPASLQIASSRKSADRQDPVARLSAERLNAKRSAA